MDLRESLKIYSSMDSTREKGGGAKPRALTLSATSGARFTHLVDFLASQAG